MNPDEVRDLLERAWVRFDREAERSKHSYLSVQRLEALYRDLSEEERTTADDVLVEWALSDNGRRRYDGLALIEDFSITSALPALRTLADRFEHSDEVSAPYDWAKVNRIIGRLVAGRSSEGGDKDR
jgi:hypothetical protein